MKRLRLNGMAANYPELVAKARHTDFDPEAFVRQLGVSEEAERAVRSMAYQMGAAHFPMRRDLASFDFSQAHVDEAIVRELHAGRFMPSSPWSSPYREHSFGRAYGTRAARPHLTHPESGHPRKDARHHAPCARLAGARSDANTGAVRFLAA